MFEDGGFFTGTLEPKLRYIFKQIFNLFKEQVSKTSFKPFYSNGKRCSVNYLIQTTSLIFKRNTHFCILDLMR